MCWRTLWLNGPTLKPKLISTYRLKCCSVDSSPPTRRVSVITDNYYTSMRGLKEKAGLIFGVCVAFSTGLIEEYICFHGYVVGLASLVGTKIIVPIMRRCLKAFCLSSTSH